jgi:hypothetical protein
MDNELLKNLAKAQLGAAAETAALNELNRIRQTDSVLFIRTLLRLASNDRKGFLLFFHQLDLTPEETVKLFVESRKSKGQTLKEAATELEQLILETKKLKPKEPTGEELFTFALEALRKENPKWTPYSFNRFAKIRIRKHFENNPKPYTNEDLTVGAKWFNTTREILTNEKKETSPRSRSYAQVTRKKWQEFYKLRFKTKEPIFAYEFERAARKKAGELHKNKNTPNLAK